MKPSLRFACALAAVLFVVSVGACSADDDEAQTPNPINGAAGPAASGGAGAAGAVGGSAGTIVPAGGMTGSAVPTAGLGGAPGGGSDGGAGSGGAAGEEPLVDAGRDASTDEPAESCLPADMLPEATSLGELGTGAAPSGTFSVVAENDPGIADQTIIRPETLGMIKHPVLAWGNGGCQKRNSGFTEFLIQLAAEGIVVIADGSPTASGSSDQNGSQLIKAIDWAEQENQRPCSKYYRKLDLTKVAVSGQSCGGLMALNASGDPRVAASMPMNSGLFARDTALYASLHAPMAIVNGGSTDIAYQNGLDDFAAIETIPIMLANLDVGHGGTYREENGGEMGELAIAWLRWHLLGDEGATGKGMFIGDACGFCDSDWDLMWKMKPP